MTEKFVLQWNNFQSNLTSVFSQLRGETNFQDVTLVSDDQRQISAHRVVLSACSVYFKNILSQNSHSHPLLCLEGINFSELSNVIDYIYYGESQIYEEDLGRFLQIAQRLQLQGLLKSEVHEQKEKVEELTPTESKIQQSENSNLLVQDQKKIKIIFENNEDFQTIEELNSYIENLITQTENGHKCNICNKISAYKSHMREHMEIHIDGLSFECKLCGKSLRSRNSLRVHKNICRKKFMNV